MDNVKIQFLGTAACDFSPKLENEFKKGNMNYLNKYYDFTKKINSSGFKSIPAENSATTLCMHGKKTMFKYAKPHTFNHARNNYRHNILYNHHRCLLCQCG